MSEPPLPPGWTAHFSKEQNRYFYYNPETKSSVWIRPTASPAATQADPGVAQNNETAASTAPTTATTTTTTNSTAASGNKRAAAEETTPTTEHKSKQVKLQDGLATQTTVTAASKGDQLHPMPAANGKASPIRKEKPLTREQLTRELSSGDAVLNANIAPLIAQWMHNTNESNVIKAAAESGVVNAQQEHRAAEITNLLSSSYFGYGELSNLVLDWLKVIPSALRKQTGNQIVDEDVDPSEQFIMDHVKNMIIQKFHPRSVSKEILKDDPPPWLIKMLKYKTWRHLFVVLAGRHKDVPLLEFAVKVMSESGHLDEVAQATDASTYYAVFNSVLTEIILRFANNPTNKSLHGSLSELKVLAGFSQYTYLFTLEMLRKLENDSRLEEQYNAILKRPTERGGDGNARGNRKDDAANNNTDVAANNSGAKTTANDGAETDQIQPSSGPETDKSAAPTQIPQATNTENAPSAVGFRYVVVRLRQELLKLFAATDDPNKKTVFETVNPLNQVVSSEHAIQKNASDNTTDTALSPASEVAQTIQDVLRKRMFTADHLTKLRSLYDPKSSVRVSNPNTKPPLWVVRQHSVLSLLVAQLFQPYKLIPDAMRNNGAFLLAHATAFSDENLAAGQEPVTVDVLHYSIMQALQICNNEQTITLQGLNRSSPAIGHLAKLMQQYPPISAGVLTWVWSCISSPKFLNGSAFSSGLPTLLLLVRTAARNHPLQLEQASFIVKKAFEVDSKTVASTQKNQLKRDVLDEMVHLMELGYAIPILEFIIFLLPRHNFDFSLLRHFVGQLVKTAGTPFSKKFCEVSLQLIDSPNCRKAVNSNLQLSKSVGEFRRKCVAEIQRNATQANGQDQTCPPAVKKSPPREAIRLVPFSQ